MHDPIITLTTDFGNGSAYVAAMKGVILCVNPRARLVDLTHDVPPQDLVYAGFFLSESIGFFPSGTIHLIVVDPGVGTGRKLLCVELGLQRLLVPDNGVWTPAVRTAPRRVIEIAQRRFFRDTVSPTFHGRDILAPVAGRLSLGLDPHELGLAVYEWVELPLPRPVLEGDRIRGEVLFVDRFGNLLTNILAESLPAGGPAKVLVEGHPIARWVRTYGEGRPGELVGLLSSSGRLEIAQVGGNAARALNVGRGATVSVWLRQLIVGMP